jgi:hypothetical protein
MSKEYIAWLIINSDAYNLIKRTGNLYTSVYRLCIFKIQPYCITDLVIGR